ncbi:unnamed protein product [Fusarium venenatum]|uniref:Period circadian protein n=1 Tax=Fusarium venenatum TaxID=56646 RepID=A0A2L2U016_9HYPO|nr:uncharacterized protein FVRRES_03467 [Fusarium venenatum]CEI66955.1 unnamed protein product [Fusarium venenatum]
MSGLINKVKEAIHSDKDKKHDSTTTDTHGTHNTHNTSSGLPEGSVGPHSSRAANAADPRVDSDLDSSRRTGAGHTTGGLGSTTGTAGHTTGGLGSTTGTTGHTTGGIGSHSENMGRSSGLPEGSVGPHSSRAANAADPRVDSDLDSSRRTGAGHTTGGLGSTTGTAGHTAGGIGSHSENMPGRTTGMTGNTGMTGTGMTGTGRHSENMPGHSTGLGSTGHSSGLPEGSVGPHSSRAANAADPRVDSDLDSSRRTGAGHTTGGLGSTTGTAGHTAGGIGSHSENMPGRTTGMTGNTGMTGTGMTGTGRHSENMPGHSTGLGSTGHSSGLPEGSVGPHSSRAANAADPRVDSDLDSSRRSGGLGGNTYDQTTTGTSGFSSHGTGAHGPTGTHSSGLSGTHSGSHMTGNTAYDSTNPGPAPKTAGPHKSDMLNKADPRVDSNLDGSKTLGKEKTFETSEPNFAGRDPTDATQVPPSIMQKHVPTEIAHDNLESDHSRRHSSVDKEHHRGL